MRTEIIVALIASSALHAGVLTYVPGAFNSHDAAAPDATSPGVVIIAHLKNTLDSGKQPRSRAATSAVVGHARDADAETRKPRLDNAMRFYPPEAVARGIEGETILMLRYNPDGTLRDARVARSSGHAILDQAALRAVHATPPHG